MSRTIAPAELERVRAIAGVVPDPELPFMTLADLGILREVTTDGERIVVSITPTYLGCPALREIQQDVRRRLDAAGLAAVEIRLVLAPPWTTDWISDDGIRKLAEAGVAPPAGAARRLERAPIPLTLTRAPQTVACPRCASPATVQQARFGAKACTALFRCTHCAEPFEHLKAV